MTKPHPLSQATPDELPEMIRSAIALVGWKAWKIRLDGLNSRHNFMPLWQSFILERYGLELAFGEVIRHHKMTGRYPWPPANAEQHRLYSFLAIATKVHARLSTSGRSRLAGAMRNSLEKEFGLGPLAHEMRTIAHVAAKGFELEFHDLELGGGFDFLATADGERLEIECKHISGDIGRQIHRRRLYELGDFLYPFIRGVTDRVSDGKFIAVTLPGRLSNNSSQLSGIQNAIERALAANSSEEEACAVRVHDFSYAESPFATISPRDLTREAVVEYLARRFGVKNSNIITHWSPGRSAVCVHFSSVKPDTVVDQMVKHLKADAKKQFSGNNPAVLCVHMADLNAENLQQIVDAQNKTTAPAIQRAFSYLISRRPHLYAIVITVDGNVQSVRQILDGALITSVQEVGPAYVMRNSDHPKANSKVLRNLFSA